MKIIITLMSIAIISTGNILMAQNPLAQLFAQKDYDDCLEQTSTMLLANANDSTALFYQGLCLLQTKQADKALQSLTKAESNGYRPIGALKINQAKCFAQLNKKEAALELIETLVANGFSSYTAIDDPLFAPLSTSNRFKIAKDSIHSRAFPCLHDDRYNHFDFWLGKWDVYVGTFKVGENIITKQNGGCMILEQYTTARDYTGQSTNFFDPNDGLWKQIWIDNTQGISKYVESERKEGYLQFITAADSSPPTPRYRMTFELQEDGSVTQVIDQQNDDGEWTLAFNGIYRRQQ